MIKLVEIKNFKSIVDLKLELGRVNIIVGANGSGKTNILEAITFASAANQDKLDNEYLGARMRMAEPDFMLSEFDEMELEEGLESCIQITIKNETPHNHYYAIVYNDDANRWEDYAVLSRNLKTQASIKKLIENNQNDNIISDLIKKLDKVDDIAPLLGEDVVKFEQAIPNTFNMLKQLLYEKPNFSSFLIYSPEESNLRRFEDETAIRPLGRKGQGLFKHIKELLSNDEGNVKFIEALNNGLSMLDWFKKIDLPSDLFTNEARVNITDRFLKETKQTFDQKSTNEGFLYLLFYLTLFNSPHTPKFFAIDNIETSFNPKLTKKLVEHLVNVAKLTDKQVILTTHSPYALDGLDLADDEQRLFVVRRNIDGHTKVKRVPYIQDRKLPLSEIWMSGVLGGLPDNF